MGGVDPAATPQRHRARIHPLRVASVEPLTADSVTIEFEVPAELAEEYEFTQGQHVSLRCDAAGDDVRRSYSLCDPAGSRRLRVAVKCLPDGVFSTHARDVLKPGDVMDVVTPTGHFNVPVDATRARNYVMVAAGSGIAPVFSNLVTVLEQEPASTVTLLYGNRTAADIMFLEELEDAKNLHPQRFAMYLVLSREEQDVPLLHGRIDGERFNQFLDTLIDAKGVDEWFLCGPRSMIDELRAVLAKRGVDAAHVHAELYHTESVEQARQITAVSAPHAAGGPRSSITIVLDGRRSTFELDRSEHILDGALRVRADAPYACRGGVCGTCRARLLEGDVEMEQCFALEQHEVDQGFVLACQSRPTSDHVVLDFDA
jgi:ring-1,2-phenylacetyl-CoA epoxidase subunit PaaE